MWSRKALAGRADRLQAYPIALEVMGRDASFDPQIDPVVRMEAGRTGAFCPALRAATPRPSPAMSMTGPRVHLLFRAMILGQLGRSEEAQSAIEAALELEPDIRERLWDMARVWNVPDPHIEHIADGLRKAGLALASASPAS